MEAVFRLIDGEVGIPFTALQRGIPAVEDIHLRKDVSREISRVLNAACLMH